MSHSVIELPIPGRRVVAGVGLVTATVLLLAASVCAQVAPSNGLGYTNWLEEAADAVAGTAPDRPAPPHRVTNLPAPAGTALLQLASGRDMPVQTAAQGGTADDPAASGFAPPIDKNSDVVLEITSSGRLNDLFERMDFSLAAVRDNAPVPRIFVAELPDDLDSVGDSSLRKELFFGTLLPLVLRVNENILHDRARLIEIRQRMGHGQAVSAGDHAWVAQFAETYGVPAGDLRGLLQRVDIIPPSMALAQAAVESGWGTSALTRRGNAVFGQTTGGPDGIRFKRGDQRYAAFDRLIDSAEAYALNLNTNPAYHAFRALRAQAQAAGRTPDGHALLAGLDNYSTLGREYVSYVRRVIRANELQALDNARLAPKTERAAGSAI